MIEGKHPGDVILSLSSSAKNKAFQLEIGRPTFKTRNNKNKCKSAKPF